MIIHRRIHKFRTGHHAEGIKLAGQLNHIAASALGSRGAVYEPAMVGGRLSRRHVVVDTWHESLAAMEQYYHQFLQLPQVQPLLARWIEIEEESWAENYQVVAGDGKERGSPA